MVDSSHTVGNGFTYQDNLSSSKLTSVLEAVAGEYALVINGHSLVMLAVSSWEQATRQENAQALWSVPCWQRWLWTLVMLSLSMALESYLPLSVP